jgi:hypothetical protein
MDDDAELQQILGEAADGSRTAGDVASAVIRR